MSLSVFVMGRLIGFIALSFLYFTKGQSLPELDSIRDMDVKYVCPDIKITEKVGILSSPSYPNRYPSHLSCSWHIQGEIGEVIALSFNDMDIEKSCCCNSEPCCTFNWLKIGPLQNETEKVFCGSSVDMKNLFVSAEHKLWIKFHVSEVKNGGRGFQFRYIVGPDPRLACDSNEFRCENSQCIDSSFRCNGFRDCRDGSDEWFCSSRCSSDHSCRSLFQCYDARRHCDGIADCPDFSDEVNCGMCPPNMTLCSGNSTRCYNPITQRCDRIFQCINGEDEAGCYGLCPGKMVCKSQRGCYSAKQRCNGITQCEDASDERNCRPDLCNSEVGAFLCDNGRCVQEVWTCDRTDDCGDGSDERNCLRNSVLTAALMGSLICALLLVIAVSCTCRLHALRTMENSRHPSTTNSRHNSHQQAAHATHHQLSRMSREFIFREPPPSYAVAMMHEGGHRGGGSLCVENLHYVVGHRGASGGGGRRRPRRLRRGGRPPPPPRPPLPDIPGCSNDLTIQTVPVISIEDPHQSSPQAIKDESPERPSDLQTDSKSKTSDLTHYKPPDRVPDSNSESVGLETLTVTVTDPTVAHIVVSQDNHFCCDSDTDPLVV